MTKAFTVVAQCRDKTWVESRESTLTVPVSHVVKGEAKELVFFVQSERRTKDDESKKKMNNTAFGVGRFLALTFQKRTGKGRRERCPGRNKAELGMQREWLGNLGFHLGYKHPPPTF